MMSGTQGMCVTESIQGITFDSLKRAENLTHDLMSAREQTQP